MFKFLKCKGGLVKHEKSKNETKYELPRKLIVIKFKAFLFFGRVFVIVIS